MNEKYLISKEGYKIDVSGLAELIGATNRPGVVVLDYQKAHASGDFAGYMTQEARRQLGTDCENMVYSVKWVNAPDWDSEGDDDN